MPLRDPNYIQKRLANGAILRRNGVTQPSYLRLNDDGEVEVDEEVVKPGVTGRRRRRTISGLQLEMELMSNAYDEVDETEYPESSWDGEEAFIPNQSE